MATKIGDIIDRRLHCREALKSMPAAAAKVAGIYREQEAVRSKEGLFCVNVADASDVRAQWMRLHNDSAALSEYIATRSSNEGIDDQITGGDSSFFGGSSADLMKEFTGQSRKMQERLEKAMEELSKTGLQEELEGAQGQKRSRKRVYSDCEGSYDFDRRFDDEPFSRMVTHKKDFPVVELLIPLANSGGISAKSISEFGARCLALADVLEKAGYRVAITGENWCRTISGQSIGGESVTGMGSRFVIRSADSYGDLESVAQFVSAEFYRRCIFPINYEMAHYLNGLDGAKPVEHGYGMPYYERPVPRSAGQIWLNPTIMKDIFTCDRSKVKSMFQDRVMWQLQCEASMRATC